MSSRPRRSAAQKASVAITDMADRDNDKMSSSRARRSGDGKGFASVSRGAGQGGDSYLTVKLPANKLRQATSNRQGSSISVSSDSAPKRATRGKKKTYVVDDSDSDEEVGEDEIQVGAPAGVVDDDDDEDEDMEDADADADADGDVIEDEMDVDAEGEDDDEDAEGEEEVELTPPQPAPVIKIAKPVKTSPTSKKTKQVTPKKGQSAALNAENSDDDELSDLDSDDEAMNLGDEDAEGDEDDEDDLDAEGDEIDDQDAEGEPEADAVPAAIPKSKSATKDVDSADDSDGEDAPDLSKMTQRQRARFEGLDESHYQALSNEVQAKKVFTVEEKAMRRAEMARRRRNLSEKRNEEVKQETINKLLKKQATKTNRKGLSAIGEEGGDGEDGDGRRPNPTFIRWTSSREGNYIAVPSEIIQGPAGRVFANPRRPAPGTGFGGPRSMVEEVS